MTPPTPIGTPGTPWGPAERARWRAAQTVQRRLADDVLPVVDQLRARFDVVEYGRLDCGVKTPGWPDARGPAVPGYGRSGFNHPPPRSIDMAYIDGFVIAVPTANRQAFIDHATKFDALFLEHGATRVVEGWGDDVPRGKITDFFGAVKAKDDETVAFSWVE